MIITCEQCKTRFKIPDEKVSAKGVKVRCTKCQHTFRVSRPAEASPEDPFGLFGSPTGAAAAPAPPMEDAIVGPTSGAKPATGPNAFGDGFGEGFEDSGFGDIPSGFDAPPSGGGLDFDPLAGAPMGAPAPESESGAPAWGATAPDMGAPAWGEPTPEPPTAPAWGEPAPEPPTAPAWSPPTPEPPTTPEASSALGHDWFSGAEADSAAPPPPEPPTRMAPEPAFLDAPADRSLFEMPTQVASAPRAPVGVADSGMGGLLDDIPDLALPPEPARAAPLDAAMFAPPQSARAAAAKPMARVPTPSAFKRAPRATVGARVVQGLMAAAILALVGGAAAVLLNGGTLPKPTVLAALQAKAVAVDVVSGLYEAEGGRPVLFVRGEVLNRGDRPERLRVHVELLDGSQTVRSGQILAGATATPEDLYRLTSSQDTEALRTRLEAQARPVGKGAKAPFVVTFYEFPPEAAGLTVRVTVEPERVQAATAGPRG